MSTKPPNARVKLTKTSVAQLEAPETGQRFVRDTDLKGFGVRITSSGRKSFILEKRINRRVRRITIGRDGEVTVAQARNRAQQLLGQIAMGEDPGSPKICDGASHGLRVLPNRSFLPV
ncbi:MAG: Arm DNA-binding domain-containing protein [Gammaproteobacteria bacterium]|nr:Arm DNA-binding domain-containing protein [Gammaproteobacteria bacterium]